MFTLLGTFVVEHIASVVGFWLVGIGAVLIVSLPPELAEMRRRYRTGVNDIAQKIRRKLPAKWQTSIETNYHNFVQGLQYEATMT